MEHSTEALRTGRSVRVTSLQHNRCSPCSSIGCLMRNLLLSRWAGGPSQGRLGYETGQPLAAGQGQAVLMEAMKSSGLEGAGDNAPARLS